MTPSLDWRGKSWKGHVRSGSGRSLGTEESRKGQGEGRRGQFHVHCSGRDSEGKGGRRKEKNAGDWARNGEDGQWGFGGTLK